MSEIKADPKGSVIRVPTEVIIAQNVAALGNPEGGQRRSAPVRNKLHVAFRTSYSLPEVVDGIARD